MNANFIQGFKDGVRVDKALVQMASNPVILLGVLFVLAFNVSVYFFQKWAYDVYVNHAKGKMDQIVGEHPIFLQAQETIEPINVKVNPELVGSGVKTLVHIAAFLVSFVVSNAVSKMVIWTQAIKVNLAKMPTAQRQKVEKEMEQAAAETWTLKETVSYQVSRGSVLGVYAVT